MSDSLALVDFSVGLVDSAINSPDRQVKFFEEFKLQKNCEINLLIKTFLGLVEMMFGPVNVSFSLPEWQAVKNNDYAPCPHWFSFFTPLHLRAYSQADWKLMCCLFTFSLKKKENLISWNHRKQFWAPDENWTLDLDALLTSELLELYGELCLIHWCPFSDAFWMFL